MLNKLIIQSLIICGIFTIFVPISFMEAGKPVVQDSREVGIIPNTELKDDDANFVSVVETFINWILGFMGILVFGLFLWAGMQYATAGGDENKTKKAVGIMTNAIVGMIILFFAFTATNLIVSFALRGADTIPLETTPLETTQP